MSESNSEAQQKIRNLQGFFCKGFFVRNFSAPYRAVWKFRGATVPSLNPICSTRGPSGPGWAIGGTAPFSYSSMSFWKHSGDPASWGKCLEFAYFAWQLGPPACILIILPFISFYALQVECTQPLTAPRTPPLPSTKFPSKPSVKKASWRLVQAESQDGSKVNATRISTNSTIKIYIDYLIFVYWFDNIISNATGPPHNQADVKSKVARKSHLPGSEVNWNGG